MSLIENFFHPKNNVEEVSSLVCKFLNLRLTNDTLCNHLRNHPFYPSLLAVHDVFEEFGVMSEAYKCNDSDKIVSINVPFLAQIRSKGSQGQRVFALIYSNDGNETDWYNPLNHKREHITIGNLKKLLTGYIMLFYPSQNSGDKDFVMHRRKEILQKAEEHALISFLPLSLMIIAIYKAFVGTFYLIATLYAILLLAGCIICGLLLMHEYNSYNPIVRSVCGGSRKINCDAVLSSPGSTIAGVPWSIIGSTYFLGSLVSILVSGFDIGVLINLCYINILSLPYTAYSLYYQKKVVRQWCPLCLSILAITWSLFFVSLLGGLFSGTTYRPLSTLICVVVSICFSAILIYMLWSKGMLAKKLETTEISYRTIRYNKDIFDALLRKGKQVNILTDGYGIVLGNPKGSVRIIEACNPYCGHCGKAHRVLSELVKDNQDVCLQIMFVMGPEDAGYNQTPVDMFLTLSREGKDMSMVLNDWFSLTTKDTQVFGNKYSVVKSRIKENDENANRMSEFCKKMEIEHTPTIFVNGYELPDLYNVGDLKYFV